jgi:hypothetical protein
MKKNKNVLVVSGFFPYPTFFGGSFDIFGKIVGLTKLGYSIDLVCTYKEKPNPIDIEYVKSIVTDLKLVKRENNFTDLFFFKPFQVTSRQNLKNVELNKPYDFLILESESVGTILDNKGLIANKIFLRVHNNESKYFYQLAKSTKNILKKLYYISDSIKYSFYSKKIYSVADRLWFISNEEINSDNIFVQKSVHLPSPINDSFSKQGLNNKTALFIGSLFMPNNIEALEWYLNNVHTRFLEDPDYKLIIVGGTGDLGEAYFENKFKKLKKVEYYLNAKDLQPYYALATVFINPMFHGAGVKLKTINALVNGLLLVSTQIGAQGIGLINNEMYINAENANEFYEAINKYSKMDLNSKKQIIESAQNHLEKNNYINVLKRELIDEI